MLIGSAALLRHLMVLPLLSALLDHSYDVTLVWLLHLANFYPYY